MGKIAKLETPQLWWPCERCGKERATYLYMVNGWDSREICESCVEYLTSIGAEIVKTPLPGKGE